tara:strand:+ start:11001 stop:12629 length:1629 start_codon:yes stop_codon:yes gene_type:complete
MKRAAIYSRFSTDLQSERSIEDQVALCRAYATRENLDIVATYDDRARSGGSVIGRDGLMRLMDAARDKQFDVVIVEALDRLSRDMEDLAGLHKRLTFAGIEIRAVHEGQVNTMLVGLRGIIGQMYREDNAHKVRRGMAGRIRDGLSGGGLTYGYRAVPGEKGQRRIVEAEAHVVRRIFNEYLDGQSPRAIAHRLNAEHVPAPRGRSWNASTINGSATRGNGILRNPIYAGDLIWNRLRMVKDPDTGRRLSRPNPESEWHRFSLPDLAIVSREIYDAVQNHKQARAHMPANRQKRPKRILSGLLRCDACGGGLVTYGGKADGRIRVRCSRHAESRSCSAPQTFFLDTIERAVLDTLRNELTAPDVIAEFVKSYHDERKRLAAGANEERRRLERRHDELTRSINRLVDAIAKGHGDPAVLGPQSTAANEERKEITARIASLGDPANLIALHPAVIERYYQQLTVLDTSLAVGMAAGNTKPAEALRELVECVTVKKGPNGPGSIEIEITGRLNALIGESAYPNGLKAVCGTVVAEDGFEPPTRGL